MNEPGSSDRLLPWLDGCWDYLLRARRADRLPHALLMTGARGVGKRWLADLLADALLCRQPDSRGLPCGTCTDCLLLAAHTHPDLLEVSPDSESKSHEIKVDAIRELAQADSLTAHRGGWKVVLIEQAHRMNPSAANAVLKTLEEPASATLICLLSDQSSRLLATIRSRCQVLRVPTPAEPQALDWLASRPGTADGRTLLRLAHGAPLRALELADREQLERRDQLFTGFAEVGSGKGDPVAEAATWIKVEPTILLDWLGGWISDLLRLSVGHPAPWLTNIDKVEPLAALAPRLDVSAGHRFLQRVWGAKAEDLANLNTRLLYESLLVQWWRIMRD
jgi:DNA polymerase-3 subunit delta'